MNVESMIGECMSCEDLLNNLQLCFDNSRKSLRQIFLTEMEGCHCRVSNSKELVKTLLGNLFYYVEIPVGILGLGPVVEWGGEGEGFVEAEEQEWAG